MCVAWFRSRKGAIIVSPPQGATDGPAPAYPLACLSGRSSERPFLPRGRHLRAAQPPCSTLRVHKAPLGLGGDHACTLPAVARGGVRALLPARRSEVLLAPVSGRGRVASFFAAPAGEETQAL